MFGRQSSLFLTARKASCHHTLRWMPLFKCTLASSRRCAANNLFIYSSRPWYSRLVAASWSWKCNSALNENGLRDALRILLSMWEGPRRPCGFATAGSSCYKMWAGLNGFDPRTDLVFGGVRNGMGCMTLVTVISEYTQVPVTLRFKCLCISEVVSSGGGTTVVTCNLRTY